MSYISLAHCVQDLEAHGQLRRIDVPCDPYLEIAAIQRRVVAAQGPALLFTKVKGSAFPMVCNLYGTKERIHFLFRHELPQIERLATVFAGRSLHVSLFEKLRACLGLLPSALKLIPCKIPASRAQVLKCQCQKKDLPRLVSWPLDGGAFITLPMVYSEDPNAQGPYRSNLGMYRIQLDGGEYLEDEVGLHYQIHRGLGIHHAHALEKGLALPVAIFVGGPPALTLASIMPLPETVSEICFAGLLGGMGVRLARIKDFPLPVLADADFCLLGTIGPVTKPEGPFGDHLGYYSLAHPFPVVQIKAIYHRPHAIWPFTTVGRPPKEDSIFGAFIHELTAPFLPKVFAGVQEVHAVDCSGVHPLLLAIGSERYTPYEPNRMPRELITQGLHLLGTSQTALAKYLCILAHEDLPQLSTKDVEGFFRALLERTDFSRDLHFLTRVPTDTLDYSGLALHEGSKLLWASCGEKRRSLGHELCAVPALGSDFGRMQLVCPGIAVVGCAKHTLGRGKTDPVLEEFATALGPWAVKTRIALVVVVDDPYFVAQNFANFLWVTFTRSDPAVDIYGSGATLDAKHFACDVPLVIDARAKGFHAPELEEDPQVVQKVEAMAAQGGPLYGCF